ncbi:GpE family phage tail protein [Burkholderia sp. IMCC1007]|nr:GpE family phage tail protein [Burkholderia sp. IMCC1007]
MADVALVFGWTPPVMDAMPVAELMGWRERARVRYERGDE